MKKTILLLIIFSVLILRVNKGVAEEDSHEESKQRRGLITSATCPYDCKAAGLKPENCREWREGSRCLVEDLTQAPGHRTLYKIPGKPATRKPRKRQARSWREPGGQGTWVALPAGGSNRPKPRAGQRGLITSASCPYNCEQAKLSADFCRDWQRGSRCFVEDLTQPPGHRTLFKVRQEA